MTLLIVGLVLFHGLHSIRMIAPEWRIQRIENLGENLWKGLYSIATLVFLVLIVVGFGWARPDAVSLWTVPEWGKPVAIVLVLLSFILVPFNLRSSRLSALTHHPFLAAIVLWSLAHLLTNSDIASVLLFGSFLLWSLANWATVRKRNDSLPGVADLRKDLTAMPSASACGFSFLSLPTNFCLVLA